MTHNHEQDAIQRANQAFIRKTMAQPLLTPERERALTLAWCHEGDQASLDELVTAYNRLVVSTAQKLRYYGLPISDLIQEGNIGLLQAANRFDPSRDVRFATYASWWVKSAMQDFVLRNWSIVRIGTTAKQKSLFFNLRRLRAQIEAESQEVFGHAGRAMIAAQLGVRMRDVEVMEQRLMGADSSLDVSTSEEDSEAWGARLVCARATPEDHVAEWNDANTQSQMIAQALDCLDARERRIIERRYLTDQPAETLEALGQDFGVSKERVRQLEARALSKLRQALSDSDVLFEDYVKPDPAAQMGVSVAVY